MNKKLFRRLLTAFAVAVFLTSGVMAQGTAIGSPADYISGDTQTEFWMTVTDTVPLYALPDAYYHPSYVAGTTHTLTSGFVWNWWIETGAAGGVTFSQTGVNDNYVELRSVTVGDYDIGVQEENTALCGGDTSLLTIHVIAAPIADFNDTVGFNLCGDQGTRALQIDIVENAPDAMASYAFAVTERIDTFNFATGWGQVGTTNNTFVNETVASKVNTGGALAGTTPNFTYAVTTSSLDIIANKKTKYTYTLASASDVPAAAGTGIVSGISHRSNYLATVLSAHPFGPENTVNYYVNPAPNTGPIYHINNTYSY